MPGMSSIIDCRRRISHKKPYVGPCGPESLETMVRPHGALTSPLWLLRVPRMELSVKLDSSTYATVRCRHSPELELVAGIGVECWRGPMSERYRKTVHSPSLTLL
jgi:hypothetical protein